MISYQQRVVDEKQALDNKIEALQAFIHNSPYFDHLSVKDRWLLTTQSHIMVQYSAILGERIQQFTKEHID